MLDILKEFLENRILIKILMLVIAGCGVTVIILYITAFFQGREVCFWPPKIGTGSNKKQQKADTTKVEIDHNSKKDIYEISWDQVKNAIEKAIPFIKSYNPDVIIGLSDGMVIAGIIAVNCPPSPGRIFRPICTLGVEVLEDTLNHRCKRIELLGKEAIPNLRGKKVLLIDNHIYTGTTMRDAINYIRTKGAKEIRTVVLFQHEMEEKVYEPDFYVYTISGGRKKVPWSYTKFHESVYHT